MKIVEIKDFDRYKLKLRKLFLSYPYKEFQQEEQNIDKNSLTDFFLSELKNKIQAGTVFCIGIEDKGNLIAICGVEQLKKTYGNLRQNDISNFLLV